MSRPGGVITTPDQMDPDTAKGLKEQWETNYGGNNAGRLAVLTDGMQYAATRENAVDAQLAEQLQLSAENVCTAFGVPPYMIGIGEQPNFANIEALNQQYYSQCLQNLIETIELLLDEGLGLTVVPGIVYGTEFDICDLLRMDSATKSKMWSDLVKGGIAAPNEARYQFDLPPTTGGDSPYLQQQNYSLAALAKRDAQPQPFAPASPPGSPAASSPAADSQDSPDGQDAAPGDGQDTSKDYADARANLVERIIRSADACRAGV